jgi:hypothetical protein
MHILQSDSPLTLWQAIVKEAESSCSVKLNDELESYLISLLIRYVDQPELAHQLFAKRFLEAMHTAPHERAYMLKKVGDECLLYAGLFPKAADAKAIKLTYFVELGQSAYAAISSSMYDVYWALAYQFIRVMDVLQSIRSDHDLLPLEAYEQWQELGSERALRMLESYSRCCNNDHPIMARLPGIRSKDR